MSARYTRKEAAKFKIIENKVKLRPTKKEAIEKAELEELQERAKKASPPPITPIKKRSKYGNKKTVVGKHVFDSKKEAKRYIELSQMERDGGIVGLILQPPYTFDYNGVRICSYVADFAYVTKDGEYVVEDVKGFKTGIYRLKKKLMRAFYGITIKES